MNIEKARELLEEVLQYRDNPQGYLTGTYASQIEKALRELQDPPNRLDTNADALHDCEKALTDLVSYWRKDLSKARDENLVLDMADDVEDVAKNLRELQPEPRIIDWQKVVYRDLPVKVWGRQSKSLAFLKNYDLGKSLPFKDKTGGLHKGATLETGQWVFNSSGENPWPEGVLVEVWLRQGARPDQHDKGCPAAAFLWGNDEIEYDIIASRAVGLEEGWTYGGEV